jgi:predicted RNase H-like nuclease (RuvC/YqgF family)
MNNNNDEEAFVIRSTNGVIAKLRADIEALQAHNSNLREALNILFSETHEELEGTRRELRAMKRRELKRKRDDLQMQLVDEIIDDLPTSMSDRYIRGAWVRSDGDSDCSSDCSCYFSD